VEKTLHHPHFEQTESTGCVAGIIELLPTIHLDDFFVEEYECGTELTVVLKRKPSGSPHQIVHGVVVSIAIDIDRRVERGKVVRT
jgi:hypothetical protein